MKKTHLPFRLLSLWLALTLPWGFAAPAGAAAGGLARVNILADGLTPEVKAPCRRWLHGTSAATPGPYLPHSRQHLPDKQLRQAPSGGAVDPRNRFYRGGGRQHRHLERLRIQPCHSGPQRTPESGRAAGSRSEGSGPAVQIDGRNYGIITPVRDQGSNNLCWAYASVNASRPPFCAKALTPATLDTLRFSHSPGLHPLQPWPGSPGEHRRGRRSHSRLAPGIRFPPAIPPPFFPMVGAGPGQHTDGQHPKRHRGTLPAIAWSTQSNWAVSASAAIRRRAPA